MRRLKALIKMELGPVLMLMGYFAAINVISFVMIQNQVTELKQRYITSGIVEFVYYLDAKDWTGSIFDNSLSFAMVMYGVGLCILVLLSFMKDKNYETGRFLKALPYTMKERTLVKMSMGMGCFLISILVLTAGMVGLRKEIIDLCEEVCSVADFEMILQQSLPAAYILKRLLTICVEGLALYLLLVLMQYLISSNLASVISSFFIFLAPPFITLNSEMYGGYHLGLEWMYFAPRKTGVIEVSYSGSVEPDYIYYSFIGDLKGYMAYWVIIILLLAFGIYMLCGTNMVEHSDVLIPSKLFRWIYIAGATLCGGFLAGDLNAIFLGTTHGKYKILVAGLIISFIIANKVGHIGCHKKVKEVAA